ncbi:class I SAM-dependent methyltransferase [Streptomyces iconiensis]|uniref:Class I SAM-dependent methyltransferase n=2 Tax=Streptomyces iconiensis TaxID=1384038 RepID=A0ABT7AAZ8_9ACTN|nr:class I SAM-dependent methyltransferase [Streptomyces iconiensis]
MEWTAHPGHGPGSEILGPGNSGRRVVELGCGPGHNIAHLAAHQRVHATGVDLVGLQVRRARSHYSHIGSLTFAAGHALHYLQAAERPFDVIYSIFGAVGIVPPRLLLPAITDHLVPGGLLAFAVPHPRRNGRRAVTHDGPSRDSVLLPNQTRLSIARWEFDASRWAQHLRHAGLTMTGALDLSHPAQDGNPTTLLITARRL